MDNFQFFSTHEIFLLLLSFEHYSLQNPFKGPFLVIFEESQKLRFCGLAQLLGFFEPESGQGLKKLEIIPILQKNGLKSILTTFDHFLTQNRT